MLNKFNFLAISLTIMFGATNVASAQSQNTQLTPEFIQVVKGKTPEQLADLLYIQSKQKYHNQYLDKCTKVEISKDGNKVIFNNFLMDDLCGGKVKNSSPESIAKHLQDIKIFRIKEIQKVATAQALLNGGVVQVYRYYVMPGNRLLGEFQISKNDIK